MNNNMKYAVVGLLIGGLVVWGLMANRASVGSNGMMGWGSQNVAQNSGTIDAHFIEQMIPHHEDAITMAKLAQTKAKRAEVKQLATNIIDSQTKEITMMKEWYSNWFGIEVSTGTNVMNRHGMTDSSKQNSMHMGMMGDETDMKSLEDAADFDKAFVSEMIPHHQMAVMMANMLRSSTQREEMQKLADDIMTAQTNEIDQMRGWLKAWGY